ncbi:hypothetical protein VNI00_017449 [Paramarasmius palmivorus]|uniref:Uncharacterized protein n=1 Tax=Paramarasmius palmivorus TaxID=297713 RepID=A0AAW0B5G6_9AGAR
MVKQRRARRKEAGTDLVDEYREVRLGDVYKTEKIHSEDMEESEDDEETTRALITGQRTIYHARLYGDDKKFTTFIYSGTDASKVFHVVLIQALLYSLSADMEDGFQEVFTVLSHMECNDWELWYNTQSGCFSCGPSASFRWLIKRRYTIKDLRSTGDMLKDETCVRYLSKSGSPGLDQDLLSQAYSSYDPKSCIMNSLFGIKHQCSQACTKTSVPVLEWMEQGSGLWRRSNLPSFVHDDVSALLDDVGLDAVYLGMKHRPSARVPEQFCTSWNAPPDGGLFDRRVLEGGSTRFSLNYGKLQSEGLGFLYTAIVELEKAWLSQAHHVFSAEGDIEHRCLLAMFHAILDFVDEPVSQADDTDESAATQIYLFVRAPPKWIKEIDVWLTGPVSFWTFDENGATQMSELTRKRLRLPQVVSGSGRVRIWSWPKYVYDALHAWQVARGFDPATIDFARSLGYPIFEPIAPRESQSDVTEDEEEPQSISTAVGATAEGLLLFWSAWT